MSTLSPRPLHRRARPSNAQGRAGSRTGALRQGPERTPVGMSPVAPLQGLLIESRSGRADVQAHGLGEIGMEVGVVSDPWEAVMWATLAPPPVIIASSTLDPDLLLGAVRALTGRLNVPVVLALDSGEVTRFSEVIRAGAQPMLGPDYTAHDLAAVLRRFAPKPSSHPLHIGRLTVFPATGEVKVGDELVHLGMREFDVLLELVRHADRVIPAAQLGGQTTGQDHLDKGATSALVCRIRRKFEAMGRDGAIQTVRGLGYRLVAARFQ